MLTITFEVQDQKMDLMVQPTQRIRDVLEVLKENQLLFFRLDKLMIYSRRKKEFVNQRLTFRQGGIYSGDILVLM